MNCYAVCWSSPLAVSRTCTPRTRPAPLVRRTAPPGRRTSHRRSVESLVPGLVPPATHVCAIGQELSTGFLHHSSSSPPPRTTLSAAVPASHRPPESDEPRGRKIHDEPGPAVSRVPEWFPKLTVLGALSRHKSNDRHWRTASTAASAPPQVSSPSADRGRSERSLSLLCVKGGPCRSCASRAEPGGSAAGQALVAEPPISAGPGPEPSRAGHRRELSCRVAEDFRGLAAKDVPALAGRRRWGRGCWSR
jgi:hypothetical protein